MLTPRGFWFLAVLTGLLMGAAAYRREQLIVVLLTLLAWIAFEWVLFETRLYFAGKRLSFDRRVGGRPVRRATLWVRQPTTVIVETRCPTLLGLDVVHVTDRLPTLTEITGVTTAVGPLGGETAIRLEYQLVGIAPGCIRFEGISLRIGDAHGLFTHRVFLRDPVETPVLPGLIDEKGTTVTVKRLNEVPSQGLHRFLKSGSGSELLDLREYVPGDPPKMIAWKASARRGVLMLREYESEVPLRCLLFVDSSDSVRVGTPPNTALVHSVQTASALARRLLLGRDHVGVCLFDDTESRLKAAAPGLRQFLRLQRFLADAAARQLKPVEAPLRPLLEPSYALADQVYPERLDPRINLSEPVLWRVWGLFNRRLLAVPLVFVPVCGLYWLLFNRPGTNTVGIALLLLFLFALTMILLRRKSGFWSAENVSPRGPARKRLATLMAQMYRLGPATVTRALYDDRWLSRLLLRFLLDHRAEFTLPQFDRDGKHGYSRPQKIVVLASALVRAMARARDNELYVLFVDLLEDEDAWEPLVRATRTALAKHHQVVMVCPWPLGIPLPSRSAPAEPLSKTETPAPFDPVLLTPPTLDQKRYRAAYERLQLQFGRLGVPVLCTTPAETVQFLLRRIETLRLAHIHRRAVR